MINWDQKRLVYDQLVREEAILERMMVAWDTRWRLFFGKPVVCFGPEGELLGLGLSVPVGEFCPIIVSASEHQPHE